MDTIDIFEAVLNLPEPWSIPKVEFKPEASRIIVLHIELSFFRGSKFISPECGILTTVYDTMPRIWRYLNFFQYKTYIQADLPIFKCYEHGVKRLTCKHSLQFAPYLLLPLLQTFRYERVRVAKLPLAITPLPL